MQPTLIVSAPCACMVYLNGKFSGEAAPDRSVFAPVSPYGAAYLELCPLVGGYDPIARKLVFSGGMPLHDALEDDLSAVLWPCGALQIELSLKKKAETSVESASLGGLPCQIVRGAETYIEIGTLRCALPEDAGTPEFFRVENAILLMGNCGGGQYVLALSPDAARQTGFLRADRIEFERTDVLCATVNRNDIVGHCTREKWQIDPAGLLLLSSEPSFENGFPRIPETPEQTARAAVEAALIGRMDEAEGYMHPNLIAQMNLMHIGEICDLCVSMEYPMPNGRACVGLLKLDGANCARVRPMYYEAEPSDGTWQLTRLELGE